MEQLLKPSQVAKILNVSPRTITNIIKSGKLKALKLTDNGHYRIKREELKKYMEGEE